MTDVQILEGALEKLRRDGWIKGTYCMYPESAFEAKETCILGALGCVADPANEAMGIAMIELGPIHELLQSLTGYVAVHEWNDEPERTFPEVEALLTAAIALARQAQAEDVAVICG